VPDTVEATASNGNITLTGTVRYGSERASAEMAVAGLTGVRNINNDIDISWDADPIDVTLYVQDALDRYALIPDDSDVVVDTSGNSVTLNGHVRTWAEHDAVLDAAWMAPVSNTSTIASTSPADRSHANKSRPRLRSRSPSSPRMITTNC
jgi:osmotically-inducible protein OsmY